MSGNRKGPPLYGSGPILEGKKMNLADMGIDRVSNSGASLAGGNHSRHC